MKDRKSAIKRSEEASVITGSVDERLASSLRSRDAILPHSAPTGAQSIDGVILSNYSLKWTRLVLPIDTSGELKDVVPSYAASHTASPLKSERYVSLGET